MTWTAEDIDAFQLLEQGLGPFQILKVTEHKEIRMTEQTPEPQTSDDESGWGDDQAAPAVTYPEYPYSLADHVYTWSPKLPDGSMLVIRSQTADGLAEAAEALTGVAGRLRAAWQNVTGAPQQAPAQGFQAPPAHAPQGNTPPPFGPNVSVPQAPGYQGPPAPPQGQQWGAPQAPPQQQWAAPTGPQLPQGWYKLTVPFKPSNGNPGKPGFDAIVAQYQLRKADPTAGGQVSFQKTSKSWYCSGEVAQLFGQFQPVPA